tara:strand:+ start:962 stop:1162 length:201 start_codon:yes stop_codon:yes gene_type:complete
MSYELEWEFDVLECSESWQEMEELENGTDVASSMGIELVWRELSKVLTGEMDGSGIRLLNAAEAMK